MGNIANDSGRVDDADRLTGVLRKRTASLRARWDATDRLQVQLAAPGLQNRPRNVNSSRARRVVVGQARCDDDGDGSTTDDASDDVFVDDAEDDQIDDNATSHMDSNDADKRCVCCNTRLRPSRSVVRPVRVQLRSFMEFWPGRSDPENGKICDRCNQRAVRASGQASAYKAKRRKHDIVRMERTNTGNKKQRALLHQPPSASTRQQISLPRHRRRLLPLERSQFAGTTASICGEVFVDLLSRCPFSCESCGKVDVHDVVGTTPTATSHDFLLQVSLVCL